MTPKIVITKNFRFYEDQINRLKSLGDVTFNKSGPKTANEWLSRCKDADIICTGFFGFKSEKLYELNNKFISVPFVGVEFLDKKRLKENNIAVANSPGCNKEAVAEWFIGMILLYFKGLSEINNINDLPKDEILKPASGLHNKTITILGAGDIGKQLNLELLQHTLGPISQYLDDSRVTDIHIYKSDDVWVKRQGEKIKKVNSSWHSDADLMISAEAMAEHIGEATKIIYLANPDNPTGTIFTCGEFNAFMRHVPTETLVIYDEAYIEFTAGDPRFPDSMSYRYDNVITLRTFSKAYGLAGIRIGYGFAHEDLISNLMKVKLPFEPSLLAQVGGRAALEDRQFLESSLAGCHEGLDLLRTRLEKAGFDVLPGSTNFLAVRTESAKTCHEICEGLLDRGIIVRPLAAFGFPELFRVTAGLPDENECFLAALEETMRPGR